MVGPTLSKNVDKPLLQLSVHRCGRYLSQELSHIFPPITDDINKNQLLACIIMQKCKHEMVEFGVDVDKEKDDLLENVRDLAYQLIINL